MPKLDYEFIGFFRVHETGNEIRTEKEMVHFAYGNKRTGKDLNTYCGVAGDIPEEFSETTEPLDCRICKDYQPDYQIIMWDGASKIEWEKPRGYFVTPSKPSRIV